ncbi:hypothetical protein BX666DRAFT_1851353 [Dichotomocladium elegans]|nr:hypothetical protein BX666DRAFT_1851353 [Dichotomocladium elegans]
MTPLPPASNVTVQVFDLQDVLSQYQSQPELLKLILSSKVEEDKRRTEEAKLRAKELDLYLQHGSPARHSTNHHHHRHHHKHMRNNSTSSHISSSSTSSVSSSSSSAHDAERQRHQRRLSSIHRQHSDIRALTAPYPSPTTIATADSPSSFSSPPPPAATSPYLSSSSVSSSSSSPLSSSLKSSNRTTRRRREMQAITKIVETREFPYQDGYFWKNNGNTTQRKTGCKSIYYKCSNSNKGCPVNKTVTERPNGEYVIKYRGDHLPECGRVERIVDL